MKALAGGVAFWCGVSAALAIAGWATGNAVAAACNGIAACINAFVWRHEPRIDAWFAKLVETL